MTWYNQLLDRLCRHGVDYIVIGGVAATAHGSVRMTLDLDILYSREPENLARIVNALADIHPYLRGVPAGLPFRFDEKTLRNGLNFTFTTDVGEIDLLGQVAGVGDYPSALIDSIELEVFGNKLRCFSLSQLLSSKRAAGRPKDLEVIAELEEIDELNS